MTYVDQAEQRAPSAVSLGDSGSNRGSTAQDIPVNPYSLLEAVNASSAAARGGWVLFLAIASFILIAVAGITHRDLLLNTKVDLPILQVEIELTRFILFAPILLLFVHFGMLIQHVMLSRKTLEFDRSIRAMEPTRRATHPLRLELHSYFFTQALAGPHRGWLLGGFLHAMIWISLVVLPVMIMLFTQVVFLPYHDTFITWVHRVVLMLDMAILAAVGVFLRRTEASFIQAFVRTMRRHPVNFIVTGSLFLMMVVLSFFVATIPGEYLDNLRPKPAVQTDAAQAAVSPGFAVSAAEFLSRNRDRLKGMLDGMVSRNLVVTDVDIVKDDTDSVGDFSLVLRNRNLRNATLDRSDLHRADLAGADFTGASLIGTNLRDANLTCSPKQCVSFNRANLTDIKLDRANLAGASLEQAILLRASLRAANLSATDLSAADLSNANLQRAKLTDEVNLFGAELPGANLRGAYLGGVNLHGANLSSAKLQGAYMAWVNAFAADLSNAELDGAFMNGAQLQGANLDNASLRGTDISNAAIWQTNPPSPFVFQLARTDGLQIEPPSAADLERLKSIKDSLPEKGVSYLLARQRLNALLEVAKPKQWENSIENSTWEQLRDIGANNSASYRKDITTFLSVLACQVRWSDGAVADGVLSRAMASNFGGDIAAVYNRVTDKSCPASGNLTGDLTTALAGIIEERSGNLSQVIGSGGVTPRQIGASDEPPQ